MLGKGERLATLTTFHDLARLVKVNWVICLLTVQHGEAEKQQKAGDDRAVHNAARLFASVTPGKLQPLVCIPWSNGLGLFFGAWACGRCQNGAHATASQNFPTWPWGLSPA